jgi:hypothetical protein
LANAGAPSDLKKVVATPLTAVPLIVAVGFAPILPPEPEAADVILPCASTVISVDV